MEVRAGQGAGSLGVEGGGAGAPGGEGVRGAPSGVLARGVACRAVQSPAMALCGTGHGGH